LKRNGIVADQWFWVKSRLSLMQLLHNFDADVWRRGRSYSASVHSPLLFRPRP
jgi:hypothetical protein